MAAMKRQEVHRIISENDNKMKLYVALLQKKKNFEKPTIQKISGGEIQSSRVKASYDHSEAAVDEWGSSELPKLKSSAHYNQDINMINIDTKNYSWESIDDEHNEVTVLVSHYGHSSSSPLINSNLQQVIPEMWANNKKILEKNEEKAPKQKIIACIRKCSPNERKYRTIGNLAIMEMQL